MYQGSSGPNHGQLDLMFSASADNSIYSLDTVQPSAAQILIIIKVWSAFAWTDVLLLKIEFCVFASKYIL